MPPGTAALSRARRVKTSEGWFEIGPRAKFAALDLAIECHDVRADGMFYMPAIDLVTAAEHYDPEGVLVWLPNVRAFATWDRDHLALHVFPRVSFAAILADPESYLAAQWNGGGADVPITELVDVARELDFVPYQPDKILWAAFQAGGAERARARRTWAALVARYPSLRDAIDHPLHGEGIALENRIGEGVRLAGLSLVEREVADRIAEVRKFYAPLVAPSAFASIDAAERCLNRERFSDAVAGLDVRGIVAGLVALAAVPAADRPAVDSRLNNALRELIVAERDRDACKVLRAYLDVLRRIGPPKGTARGAFTGGAMSIAESIASHAVVIAARARDRALFARLDVLVPTRITDPILAFNLACYHALVHDDRATLRYTRRALALGKTVGEFEVETDFAGYRDHAGFRRLLGLPRVAR